MMIRIIAQEMGPTAQRGVWHIVQLHDVMRISPGVVRASRVDTACGKVLAEQTTTVNLNRGTTPPNEPTCLLCHDRGMNPTAATDIREAVEAGEAGYAADARREPA